MYKYYDTSLAEEVKDDFPQGFETRMFGIGEDFEQIMKKQENVHLVDLSFDCDYLAVFNVLNDKIEELNKNASIKAFNTYAPKSIYSKDMVRVKIMKDDEAFKEMENDRLKDESLIKKYFKTGDDSFADDQKIVDYLQETLNDRLAFHRFRQLLEMQYEFNMKYALLNNDIKEEEMFLVVPIREFRDLIANDFNDNDLLSSIDYQTRHIRQVVVQLMIGFFVMQK